MRFPNWLRIAYWMLATGATTTYLAFRFPSLQNNQATLADAVAMVIWFAMVLLPLFAEFEFAGFKFKAQVEALKTEVRRELSDLRNEVHNAVQIRTTVSPTIHLHPAPDPELAHLRAKLTTAAGRSDESASGQPPPPVVPPAVARALVLRQNIDHELDRIAAKLGLGYRYGRPNVLQIAQSLVEFGFVGPEIGTALREVYAVSSAAIHGDELSTGQVAFLTDVGPTVLQALRGV